PAIVQHGKGGVGLTESRGDIDALVQANAWGICYECLSQGSCTIGIIEGKGSVLAGTHQHNIAGARLRMMERQSHNASRIVETACQAQAGWRTSKKRTGTIGGGHNQFFPLDWSLDQLCR